MDDMVRQMQLLGQGNLLIPAGQAANATLQRQFPLIQTSVKRRPMTTASLAFCESFKWQMDRWYVSSKLRT